MCIVFVDFVSFFCSVIGCPSHCFFSHFFLVVSLFNFSWLFYVRLIYHLSLSLSVIFCVCLVFSSLLCQNVFYFSLSLFCFIQVHIGKFLPAPVPEWNCQRSPNCRAQTQNLAVAPASCMLGKGDEGAGEPKWAGCFCHCVCVFFLCTFVYIYREREREREFNFLSTLLFLFCSISISLSIFHHSDSLRAKRMFI